MLVERAESVLQVQRRNITVPRTDLSLFALVIPSNDVIAQSTINAANKKTSADAPGQGDVRRPLDGMRARDDNYATLSVILGGSSRKLIDNSSVKTGKSKYTANILVQSVSSSATEKMQLTQTFDKDRLFFFGSNLETMQVQAIVIENESFQWLKEFYENYNKYFKGTSLAEENNAVEFMFEDKTIVGYLTQFSFTRTSEDLHQAMVSFTLIATSSVFNRPLVTKNRVLTPHENLANVQTTTSLEEITEILNTSSEFQRRGSVAPTDASLRNQIGFNTISVALSSINKSFYEKEGSLRESYPNEYPNFSSGKSLDVVRDIIETSSSAIFGAVSPSSLPTTNLVFDLPEPARTETLLGPINQSIAIHKLNAKRKERLDDSYRSEDLFFSTKFESWTPGAMDIEMAQLKNVGASLAYLAASAIISASATEALGVLTGGDFNPSRMGSNISQRIFGEDITQDESQANNRNLTGVI